MEGRLISMRNQIVYLKQQALSNNLRISGVPLTPDQDLVKLMINISKFFGVEMTEADITKTRLINTKKGPLIIVTLNTKDKRDEILFNRRGKSIYAEEIGLRNNGRQQIYIQEDLTKEIQEIYFHARQLRKFGVTQVIPSDGRILVRLPNNKKVNIRSIEHVQSLAKELNKPKTSRAENARNKKQDKNNISQDEIYEDADEDDNEETNEGDNEEINEEDNEEINEEDNEEINAGASGSNKRDFSGLFGFRGF
jgi:hypothetical protein